MQAHFALSKSITALAVFIVILNILPWKIQPVSPALLIYAFQDSPIPIIFSPFLTPHWKAAVARILQLGWLLRQRSSPRNSLLYYVQLYSVLLAARAGTGFLFGRSVGWAHPQLFSHHAVYEPVAGFGPVLLGALLFVEVLEKRQLLGRFAIILAFILLDEMPWSYTCGAAIAGIHRLLYSVIHEGKFNVLPSNAAASESRNANYNHPSLSSARIFALSTSAMALAFTFGNISGLIVQYFTPPVPQLSDVHIVMLTVPRSRDLFSDVMIESILSYIEPWHKNTNSSITVFAHLGPDGKHIAFDRAKAFFRTNAAAQGSAVPVNFHLEPVQGVDRPIMNHHMHLADAVRYAYEAGHEWTMFVEDDFVLCGQWGWENFMKVMARVSDGSRTKKVSGAFIGTGGSGVVFNRSLLPTVEQILSSIVALDAREAKHPLLPPDVLMQRCLTGELLFCPTDGWVISSRMLMGHRGGTISTGNRKYEDGKWACGWRHPQHGQKGAEVVVV